jgi:hypothetical protein
MKSPFSQIPLNLGPNMPNGSFYDQSHSAPQGFGMVNELNSKMHLEQHDEGIQSTFSTTMSKPKDLPEQEIKTFSDSVLFYIFYNMPNDRAQI